MAQVNLHIAGASYKAAQYACLNWHYAKRMPVGKLCILGVWEDGCFLGVVIFGSGSSGVGSIYKGLGLGSSTVCELQRVALREHVTAVTRILAIALKILKQTNPGLSLVVSYADPGQGHKGTIYQAGNWFAYGQSDREDQSYRFLDGTVLHSRVVDKSGYKLIFGKRVKCRRPDEAIEIITLPRKHRFLYALDDKGREAIMRAKQAMAGPPAQRRGSDDPHAPKQKKGRGTRATSPK